MSTNPYQPPGWQSIGITRRGAWIALPIFCLAAVNFIVFASVAKRIGGDAVNGKVEDGRYYVMRHGDYTEVSRAVFIYSYVHAVSVWITHSAVFVVLGVLWWSGDWTPDPRRAKRMTPGA